jgi:hypothetical protein
MKARLAALGGALCGEPFPLDVPMFTQASEKSTTAVYPPETMRSQGSEYSCPDAGRFSADVAGISGGKALCVIVVSFRFITAAFRTVLSPVARFDLQRGNDLLNPVGVHRQHHRFADVVGRIDSA